MKSPPALRALALLCATLTPARTQQATATPTAPRSSSALSFRAAADYSKKNQGLAVLILENGEKVFEEYQNGYNAKKAHHIYSGTKSFVPIVALIAQEEGLLKLDEAASDTITEWQDDERRKKITIRQLLNFTSGLKVNDREMHSPQTRDKYASAIACEAAADPGRRFQYGSCHLMAFGELFKRKLRAKEAPEKDFVDYLKSRVLDPIGCNVTFWLRDGKRNPALPYGAFLTAREWAKFGQLLLDRGRHGKKQLIPTEHFDECFVGSKANPIYGLNFWLLGKREQLRGRDTASKKIPADSISASGMYKQRLIVIPSKKLVIVRFGQERKKSRFNNRVFLSRLFTEPSTSSPPAPGDKKSKR